MEATVKSNGNGVLNGRALDRLNLLVGRATAALPSGETVSGKQIQCLLGKDDALLGLLADIAITDELESLQHATVLHSMNREKLIRTWQEVIKIRILVFPLAAQLYALAPALRLAANAVNVASEQGMRISMLAEGLVKHALRLDVEYQWFERQMCPGIEKTFRPKRKRRPTRK